MQYIILANMFTLTPTVISKSSNPGLSLLSRGIGEEKQNRGHKKLEVCLEPEDYHNIQGKKFYLPPLQQQAWTNKKDMSPREIRAHKTYTTRKGALLLYAEDLALTAKDGATELGKNRSLEAEDSSYFNSINDLRNAVLSYGSGRPGIQPEASNKRENQQPFLGFVHNKRRTGPFRSVRPGFSAKRYLANWSRSWDDSILNYLRTEGHIWDKNLFQQNVLAPNLYRRINDDLSLVPLPYRFTRNMLMSPGEFESLEFYRIRPDSANAGGHTEDGYEADTGDESVTDGRPRRKKKRSSIKPFNLPGSIAMIVRDMEQKPHAVQYQDLQEDQQRQVLQRLLLQSALHQQQHLRMIKEEQEKRKGEEEEEGAGMEKEKVEDGKASIDDKARKEEADKMAKLPVSGRQGLGPKPRRTDTSMTQYGSPPLLIPEAKEVDMEQAIANLITSNSTNLLDGSKAFTDQTILDMYKATRAHGMRPVPAPPPSTSPSQWPQASRRKVKSNLYHTYPANFAGMQPLPPIQNTLEGGIGGGDSVWSVPPAKQNLGPPVITMEPPTPQHPRMSGTLKGSRLTVGSSSQRGKSASNASLMSSSETNVWRADVDEDVLLQQQEAEQERAASDQEEWAKSPRSSQKSSVKKASSKQSMRSNESKGSSGSGPALSINSHLSRSLENISPTQDSNPNFPTGRPVPSRLRESMRSYKGSAKSSTGSLMLAGPGDNLLITGSKKGSDYAPSITSQLDRVPSPAGSLQPTELSIPDKWALSGTALEGNPEPKADADAAETNSAVAATTSNVAATRSAPGSTVNLDGSTTDDRHSVITDEFPTPDLEGEEREEEEEAVQPEIGDTREDEEAKSVKLGQGVIDLPVAEATGPRKSLTGSKKSSILGSVKAESVHSEKGDEEHLSDHGAEEEDWPGETDQSKDITDQQEDQVADETSRKTDSGAESEVEIEITEPEEPAELGEAGSGDGKASTRASSLLELPASASDGKRSRPQTVESQLEQLVKAAEVVVDQIMQRPKSGRDLAQDAQMAAELWSDKLGELFTEDDSQPDRIRSAPYRRRRNSLDAASVTSSMLEEQLYTEDRVTPMSSRKIRKSRRIHSAEAAISLLRHLLKDAKQANDSHKAGGDDGSLGLGVTNLGVAEKADPEKKAALVRVPPTEEKPDSEAKLNEELAKIVQETGLLDKKGSKSKKGSSTKTSTKSSKSGKSKKSSSPAEEGEDEKKKEEFVVSMPKESKADILLYKPMTPEPKKDEPKAPPKEKKKIQKKVKKAPAAKPEKPKKAAKKKGKSVSSKTSQDGKEDDEKSNAGSEKKEEEEKNEEEEAKEEKKEEGEEEEREDDEEEEEDESRASPESPEFIFIQDPVKLPDHPDEIQLEPTISAAPSEDYSEITDFTEDSTSQGPQSITRSQAKAFKRAAEAEKRKAAVEKKRREREEAKKKAQEEAERAERIKLEYEEEKRRKEEEAREQMEKAALERERMAREEEDRQRQAALAAERERRQQAEYKRKMEEMAKRKREEEIKRKAEEEQRRKEEEERKRIEAEMLAAMEEAERLEYEKRKKAEELEAQRRAEEERIRREIEEKIAEEQARLLAIEMAKRQKELEARLNFNKELHSEANIFAHSQEMTRAFTWSYFELLEHLGIEIPDSLREHYKEIAESNNN